VDLDPVEVRVLGCLVEKQRTTPDVYPLSLNALRTACNQATNRDPVVAYDEEAIRGALHRLGRRRFTRLASGHGSRASKYRHLLEEALGIDREEQAVLAVLLLRGPQTPGELKQRTERLQPFADLEALEAVLGRLVARELVARLARRPGQKEERYAHRLSEELEDTPAPASAAAVPSASSPAPATAPAPASIASPPSRSPASIASPPASSPAASPPAAPPDGARLDRLEREVAELRSGLAEVAELRAELAALRAELGA
jgi:uncharacterized protein